MHIVKSYLLCALATNNAVQLTMLEQTAQVGRKTAKVVILIKSSQDLITA